MRLRPLNNVLIVEPDPIEKYQGMIVLPDKNSEEKISPFATVVSWGNKCVYKYKIGQKVVMPTVNAFKGESPSYFFLDGKKYRFIVEHMLNGVIED